MTDHRLSRIRAHIRAVPRHTVLVLCGALPATACSDASLEDLEAFVAETGRPVPSTIPRPRPPTPMALEHEPHAGRDPFRPPSTQWKAGEDAAPAPAPDLDRPRTALEHFSITELRMVGVLARDGLRTALVRDALGKVHRVQRGDYVGRDFGRIESVEDHGLRVRESIATDGVGWVTRHRTITLSRADAPVDSRAPTDRAPPSSQEIAGA